MEAKKVKKNSKNVVANKDKYLGCNDDNEPTLKAVGSKRKDNQQGKKGNTKLNLNDCETANKKGKLSKRRFKSGEIKIHKEDCERFDSKGEMTNSSILDSASVSDSASPGLCRFACSNCSFTFASWRYLQAHEKNKHQKTIHTSNIEAYLFKASVHYCKICSKKVLNDCQLLASHFQSVHSMSLNQYRQQYNCNSVQNIQKTQLSQRMENAKQSRSEIGNFCTFRCPRCKKIFYSMPALKYHCSPNLGNNCKLEKIVDWRTCIEKVVTHKCKICSKLLLCDNEVVRSHVKNHGIRTIGEYVNKTGCTLQTHENDKDGRNILNSKKAKFSTQIGNFCTYTCHDCEYVSENWRKMKDHLKTFNHGSANSSWQQYITKAVLHQCKFCKKNILNDYEFCKKHIYHHHQMSIPEYKLRV